MAPLTATSPKHPHKVARIIVLLFSKEVFIVFGPFFKLSRISRESTEKAKDEIGSIGLTNVDPHVVDAPIK